MKNKILIFTLLLIISCKKDNNNNNNNNNNRIAQSENITKDSIKDLYLPIDSKYFKYTSKDKNGFFIYDHTFNKNLYSNSLSRVFGKLTFNKNIELIFIERKPADDEYTEPIVTLYSYEKSQKQKIDSLNLYETIKSEANLEKRFTIDKEKKIDIYENSSGYDLTTRGKDTLIVERSHRVYYISASGKFIEKREDINSVSKRNIAKPDKTWIGEYFLNTDAISRADNKSIKLKYYITINSLSNATLSIGAENPQDYACEGDYTLQAENNTLSASGKCDSDDINDFYIKKENNSFYIKSKRFINQDWQELRKD